MNKKTNKLILLIIILTLLILSMPIDIFAKQIAVAWTEAPTSLVQLPESTKKEEPRSLMEDWSDPSTTTTKEEPRSLMEDWSQPATTTTTTTTPTPDTATTGTTGTGTTGTGTTDTGTTDTGTTGTGTTDPGTTDPGTTDPGTTDPETPSVLGIRVNRGMEHSAGEIVSEGKSFIEAGTQKAESSISQDELQKMSNTLYNILLVAGIIIAVVMGLLLGVKFIMGSVEQKAEVKAMLVPYVIGIVVIFGAFTIWKIIVDVLQSA